MMKKGVTLVSASSIDKELKLENGSNIEAATKVGQLLAKRAKEQKITKVSSIEEVTNIMDVLKHLQMLPVKMD